MTFKMTREDFFLTIGIGFTNLVLGFITVENINVITALASGIVLIIKNLPFVFVRCSEIVYFIFLPKMRGRILMLWREEIRKITEATQERLLKNKEDDE